jgi:hypothetical protein
MIHREIPVKVTAWVDEGVAALVIALNELEDVMTLDSCQGDDGRPAHVFFRHRGDARAATLFAADLAAALAPHADEHTFRLACPAAHVNGLVRVLSEVAEPAHDSCGTALRS